MVQENDVIAIIVVLFITLGILVGLLLCCLIDPDISSPPSSETSYTSGPSTEKGGGLGGEVHIRVTRTGQVVVNDNDEDDEGHGRANIRRIGIAGLGGINVRPSGASGGGVNVRSAGWGGAVNVRPAGGGRGVIVRPGAEGGVNVRVDEAGHVDIRPEAGGGAINAR